MFGVQVVQYLCADSKHGAMTEWGPGISSLCEFGIHRVPPEHVPPWYVTRRFKVSKILTFKT